MSFSPDAVFYLLFVSQIFVISYYLPERLLKRMRRVTELYPPSTHPKLYPRPVEYYKIGQSIYRFVNRAILALGVVILLSLLFLVDHSTFADDGYISEAWPAAYAMIQLLPILAVEMFEFSQFKQMRKANTETSRSAELVRRRLFDFVSPRLFAVAAVLFGVVFVFSLFGEGTVGLALWLAVGNLFLASVGAWTLYGRKLNPHQDHADRARHISASLTSMCYVSIVMSAFYVFSYFDRIYEIDYLDASLMSIYFQLIALLSVGHMMRTLKIEDINFDVYRNGAPAT